MKPTNTMELKEYQELASRTCANLPTAMDNDLHMVLGLQTEVGELADVYKRALAYKKDIDLVNVKEEVGDIIWYLMNFCTLNKIDIHECLQMNINKLQKRFPNKFNTEDALNRDLDKERAALEA